jgi:hypothetical protein
MKYIGCGGWVSYYYFLIGSSIAKLLKEDIVGFGKSFQILNDLIISQHKFLILFISYFSEFFFGIIIYIYLNCKEEAHIKKINKYEKMEDLNVNDTSKNSDANEKKKNSSKEIELLFKGKNNINDISPNELNNNLINDDSTTQQLALIVENKSNEANNSQKSANSQIIPKKVDYIHNNILEDITEYSFSYIFLSCFLLIINDVVMKWIFSKNEIFDYFFINLLNMTLIFKIHYKENIYSHQYLALLIIFFIGGALFVACLFEKTDYTSENETIWEAFDINFYMIFVFIIIYFLSSICLCYGTILQKKLMDFKFVSPYKIIFIKGILGIIFSAILIAISTYIPCKENHIVNIVESNIDIKINKIILSEDSNSNLFSNNNSSSKAPPLFECVDGYDGDTYFDNFFSYLNTTKNLEDKRDKYFELYLYIPLYCIFHFIYNILLILVNKILSPTHCLIVDSLYRIIHIPIQLVQNIHIKDNSEGFFYEFIIQPLSTKILRISAYIISIIGYCIYLEIIELKCCELNKNIIKNIRKRAKSDGKQKEKMSTYSKNSSKSSSTLTNEEEN